LARQATVKASEQVMTQIGPDTNGIYIISVTAFTDQGDIDWASVDSLVEFYIAKGVSGVTILGMMGEAHKLAETESVAFAKHFIGRVGGRGDRGREQSRHRQSCASGEERHGFWRWRRDDCASRWA
jgi:hypothetical protein